VGFGLSGADPRGFARLLLLTTAGTTLVWLAVTYLTAPEPAATLRAFSLRARPGGPGWRAVAPEAATDARLGAGLLQWALGCVVVYPGLFGIGDLGLGRPVRGLTAPVVGAAVVAWIVRATGGRPPAGPGARWYD
jgi:SSS family solute:Na+ symporter